MDAAAFLASFPEFSSASVDLIEIALAEADLLVSDTWGDKRETVIGLEAAARLHDSPQGRNARIAADVVTANPYGRRLARMRAAHACGLLRIG